MGLSERAVQSVQLSSLRQEPVLEKIKLPAQFRDDGHIIGEKWAFSYCCYGLRTIVSLLFFPPNTVSELQTQPCFLRLSANGT